MGTAIMVILPKAMAADIEPCGAPAWRLTAE
jgi:hypothetical protein